MRELRFKTSDDIVILGYNDYNRETMTICLAERDNTNIRSTKVKVKVPNLVKSINLDKSRLLLEYKDINIQANFKHIVQ